MNETTIDLTIRVRQGDTLWLLAKRYYGHGQKYGLILAANHILDPRKLAIGRTLVIPGVERERLNRIIEANPDASLYRRAKDKYPTCNRCADWSNMGLSNRCPSCETLILKEYEEYKAEAWVLARCNPAKIDR